MKRIENFFRLKENKTSFSIEITAGITTFMTMAYIIIVQPAVLSGQMFGLKTGMDLGAIMTATCLAAALATILMGLWANYPIAQAPGMGENFFFVFTVIPAAKEMGVENPWSTALGVVFIAGILFLILSLIHVRKLIISAISPSLKNGIAAGIGLFIAFIGLKNAGIITGDPGTLVKLNVTIPWKDLLVFSVGLFVMAALHARKIRGSIIWGILSGLFISLCLGKVSFSGIVAAPPSLKPTFLKLDLVGAISFKMWPYILLFLFMDIFDTIGTLIGVGEQAGFIRNNQLPRANRALLSDAVGTVAGAALGTSTVTSFIESATGVEHGGRTGLANMATALCFLLALFFSPLVKMIAFYAPITAPALVLVGTMMLSNVIKIDWKDYTEALPSFLILIGVPLTYSIADGLALGLICYPIIKLLAGKYKQIHPLCYFLCLIFIIRYVFL
ncbi:MAG: NCS2 family permease [Candidatus Theseobacter exili]|nr:NCS2 family permease [Candidatus Theseobacter exili]